MTETPDRCPELAYQPMRPDRLSERGLIPVCQLSAGHRGRHSWAPERLCEARLIVGLQPPAPCGLVQDHQGVHSWAPDRTQPVTHVRDLPLRAGFDGHQVDALAADVRPRTGVDTDAELRRERDRAAREAERPEPGAPLGWLTAWLQRDRTQDRRRFPPEPTPAPVDPYAEGYREGQATARLLAAAAQADHTLVPDELLRDVLAYLQLVEHHRERRNVNVLHDLIRALDGLVG